MNSISGNLESNTEQEYIERCIRDLISSQDETMSQMGEMVKNLKADEAELENKIKRRGTELDRAEKRLNGIVKVKPEFMDEYERLEQELERFYALYVDKYRNLDYLEHELDLYNKMELAKKAESEKALKRIQKQFQEEEYKIIHEGEDEKPEGTQEMAETRSGFNKMKQDPKGFQPGAHNAVGQLEGNEEESEEEIGEDEGSEEGGEQTEEEEEEEEEVQGPDHNF